jgi:hypothetical protein
MSDDHALYYEPFQKLTLDGTELRIGKAIEIYFDGEWRAGTVQWSREWSAFYIQLPNKPLWMWEGLPARRPAPPFGQS